ncbi:DUF3147 family protein [Sphingomonas sp. 28-63-12]|uniref:DUF3147 family protein n=1 Tax=Sphingomonas sp. 28-63-12 TaxID=1970434 RepID=UPI000BC767CA|nr:MAG: hypothetical protein B7Y47_10865 [Sphingomonas sp. 28-63-12]
MSWLAFAARAALAGVIVAAVALIARRSPVAGAIVASLPLVSVLGMMFLWHDTHDPERLATHAGATLWYVIPSLPMFALLPVLLRNGISFWASLAMGCTLTVLLYLATTLIAARFGVTL